MILPLMGKYGLQLPSSPMAAAREYRECGRKEWEALLQLIQVIWEEGRIPTQLGWVITVLIPKGGSDYCRIGLLEPIWKVIEWVIDKWLEVIALYSSLHGCCNRWGTGTAVIEAKHGNNLPTSSRPPSMGSLST